MSDPAIADAISNTDRFYTQVKSLHGFDTLEVRCVINNLLTKTQEETCYLATYIRTVGNIESLLQFNASKDVQAIAMIARALFELAVDLRLLETTPLGWIKMTAHADLEKLRLAARIIAFKEANPSVQTDTTVYQKYIEQNSGRVTGLRRSLWPKDKTPKHWSGLHLGDRCAKLGAPFDQTYAEDYARVSWYAHPGLTGVVNVPAETFIHVCGYAYHLAVKSYKESLMTMIRVFKLSAANDHIGARLDAALKLPFTDAPEQVEVLRKRAGL